MKENKARWITLGVIGLTLMVLSAFQEVGPAQRIIIHFVNTFDPPNHGRSRERSIDASLKTIATAQADYRANDRDGNGIEDYWRKDIASLYAIDPLEVTGYMIKLVDISIAGADADPIFDITTFTQPGPKAGYLFKTLAFADEFDSLDPDRFAACVYPANYRVSGFKTYIINHENIVYWRDLGRSGGISTYPTNPLAQGWEKTD